MSPLNQDKADDFEVQLTDRSARLERAAAALAHAREAFEQFRSAWRDVGHEVRRLDEHQWHRVDAYPGWDGLRDVGAGQDLEGWMDEVEERLDQIRSGL